MPAPLAPAPLLVRKVTVTLGLSGGGAIVGGAAGALALLVVLALRGAIQPFIDVLWILAIPGSVGALLGVVLTPITGWMLLRRVPLGRAFLGLAAGTILGGIVGDFLADGFVRIESSIAAAVVGFCAAAVALRYLVREQHDSSTPDNR